MNEKVENLVLEQLRQLRADNGKIIDEIRGLRSEVTAFRHHVRGLETMQDQHQDSLMSVRERLDRIERRLELTDAQPQT